MQLAQKAIVSGYHPTQETIVPPLLVKGVGNGHQECKWKGKFPIALRHNNDQEHHVHTFEAPICEGTGEDLPGLLGGRTMETEKMILDFGTKLCHIPGPGEVIITLPPGSITIPMERAPSGHFVLPVDGFDQVPERRHGIPEVPLALHASAGSSRDQSLSQSCVMTRVVHSNTVEPRYTERCCFEDCAKRITILEEGQALGNLGGRCDACPHAACENHLIQYERFECIEQYCPCCAGTYVPHYHVGTLKYGATGESPTGGSVFPNRVRQISQ